MEFEPNQFESETSKDKMPCGGEKDVIPQDLLEIYNDIQSDSDSEQIVLSESESDSESEDNASSYETDFESEPVDCGQSNGVQWTDEPLGRKEVQFYGEPGLLVELTSANEPIEFFELFADSEFYDMIVFNTNAYAKTVRNRKEKLPEWKELTRLELKVFLGLLLHMGHIQIPHLADYWNKDPLLNMSCFSSHMPRSRFLMILKCLQFAPVHDHLGVAGSELYKFLPLLQHFNVRLSRVYTPSRDLTLDVPITLHKGRVVLSHDPRGKGGRHGIKLYTLTDTLGVAVKSKVYSDEDPRKRTSVEDIVIDLMSDRLNLGHSLYIGEFYTSHELAVRLRKGNTYCTGPLRIDRLPRGFSVPVLRQGQLVCKQAEGVSLCKWKDRRHIFYITSEPDERLVDVRSKGKLKKRPRGLVEHDRKLMNARREDDLFDCYPCERTPLRWYKKFAVHIIQMMVLNAYRLFVSSGVRRCSLLEFRLSVVRRLLSMEKALVTRCLGSACHLPIKHPANERGKALRKRCKLCYSLGKRKDTTYCCPQCPDTPALCIQPCFARFHHSDLLT